MFRAGICPDCGAGIYQGMTACKVCELEFSAHAHELPQQKAKAPAAQPPQQQPPPQQQQPPPQHQQPPQQPPQYAQPPQQPQAAPRERASGGEPRQASLSPIPSPQIIGKPLTAEDLDELERGSMRPSSFPLTDAEGPEYVRGAPEPLLGSALSRAAIVVMADAAVVDDPLVLLGHKPVENHLARAMINLRRSATAETDDPEGLLMSRSTGGAAPSLQPEPTSRSAHAQESALPAGPSFAPPPAQRPSTSLPAPDAPSSRGAPVAVPRAASLSSAQNTGKPLTFEEMERIEHPLLDVQPHSFAEATDFVFGANDPLLGAAKIKGANAVMADAAVIDDPLVLLGYPPVMSHVARQAINLRRSDAPVCDEVGTLLQRPTTAAQPSTAPTGAPRAAAPSASPSGSGRPPDPDATALLDQNAVMAAARAVAEEEARAQQQRRPATSVGARGGARSLDEK